MSNLPHTQKYKLIKSARTADFEVGGPQKLENALQLLAQAKAIGNPPDKYLKEKGIKRNDFENYVENLHDKTKDKEQFNAKELVPNPKVNTALGGAGGGLLGGLAGYLSDGDAGSDWSDIGAAALGTVAGGGLGALVGNESAKNKRDKMLKTLKILRNYGVNDPGKLRKSLPILTQYGD